MTSGADQTSSIVRPVSPALRWRWAGQTSHTQNGGCVIPTGSCWTLITTLGGVRIIVERSDAIARESDDGDPRSRQLGSAIDTAAVRNAKRHELRLQGRGNGGGVASDVAGCIGLVEHGHDGAAGVRRDLTRDGEHRQAAPPDHCIGGGSQEGRGECGTAVRSDDDDRGAGAPCGIEDRLDRLSGEGRLPHARQNVELMAMGLGESGGRFFIECRRRIGAEGIGIQVGVARPRSRLADSGQIVVVRCVSTSMNEVRPAPVARESAIA